MPVRKIPPDAVTYYLSLGPGRSYQKVAEYYGVTKRAVTKIAVKEHWQEKVAEIERSTLSPRLGQETPPSSARRPWRSQHDELTSRSASPMIGREV